MSSFYDSVRESGTEIIRDEPLKKHTTFKIGGNAKYFIIPEDEKEIAAVLKYARTFGEKVYIIGNGSNMLVDDAGVDGAFIYIGDKMSDISLEDETTIRCQAGALLSRVCKFALENSLTGMEASFGIPGSVGGGLYMNAGAYGTEMKDYVVKAEYLDPDGSLKECSREEMKLSYRHSVFSENSYIITAVYIGLKKGDKSEIRAAMTDYMTRRKAKQPLEYPSAGSVFKRPEGYFAGALIEQCGLKGRSIGDAQVSEKHAGFIINKGNATCKDVTELIRLCQYTVFKEKGVRLETEIKAIR
ncbi:MAG: UDP-N-acetylmuramate dehydrogenase [Acutalibacteraceae bacterium]